MRAKAAPITEQSTESTTAENPHADRTTLINPTVGSDFGVGRVVMHSVLRGACVPPGKDRSKVGIGLSDAVQHGSARDTQRDTAPHGVHVGLQHQHTWRVDRSQSAH